MSGAVSQLPNLPIGFVLLLHGMTSGPGIARQKMNSRVRLLRRLTLRNIVFCLPVCLTILDVIEYALLNIRPRKLPQTTASNPPKLFIASTHWNNARILRSHWNSQILQISEYFGRENIFISISPARSILVPQVLALLKVFNFCYYFYNHDLSMHSCFMESTPASPIYA